MRKVYRVLREMLHRYYLSGERFFNQKDLASSCGLSLGTVNPFIKKLERMRMVEVRPLGMRLLDPHRMLVYWAAKRDLFEDLSYVTYAPEPVEEIESSLRPVGLLTAHSGFRHYFGRAPDYSEVYVYARREEVERRYPNRGGTPNLYVLKPDEHLSSLSKDGVVPLVQIYADLWQLGQFWGIVQEEMERFFRGAPLRAIEGV